MEIANAESVSERMADFLVIFFERLERQGVAGNWQGQYGETSLGIIWALPGYCRFYQNIDPEGLIKIAEIHDNGIGRNSDELMRKVQAAQFVATHKGEVCPAKWKPGSETLKPGLNLVGKIKFNC